MHDFIMHKQFRQKACKIDKRIAFDKTEKEMCVVIMNNSLHQMTLLYNTALDRHPT